MPNLAELKVAELLLSPDTGVRNAGASGGQVVYVAKSHQPQFAQSPGAVQNSSVKPNQSAGLGG